MDNDSVNHPQHYNQNGIECFDVISAFFGKEALEDFCLGNALKYLMRCQHKGKYIEDLKKAKFYIEKILALRGEPQADLNQILEEIKKNDNGINGIDSKMP